MTRVNGREGEIGDGCRGCLRMRMALAGPGEREWAAMSPRFIFLRHSDAFERDECGGRARHSRRQRNRIEPPLAFIIAIHEKRLINIYLRAKKYLISRGWRRRRSRRAEESFRWPHPLPLSWRRALAIKYARSHYLSGAAAHVQWNRRRPWPCRPSQVMSGRTFDARTPTATEQRRRA